MMTKEEMIKRIKELKEKRKAVILVHNYQRPEVQDLADYLGDSLGLSQKAGQTAAEVIVFCGVHFMAETASILCPDKKVLMPEPQAGCPMADMIDRGKLLKLKKEHPQAVVVTYVNSTAEVKAESDICCTSANAVEIVKSLKDKEIIFIPDKYLGQYVMSRTGKQLILYEGYCPTHAKILAEDIIKAREEHPRAVVLAHPECNPEVLARADEVLSTGGMVKFARQTGAEEMIIVTEIGIIYRLEKENPQKKFYPVSQKAVCPNMKMTTLEKVMWSLEEMKFEIKVAPEIQRKAKKAVERMLELSKQD